MVFFHKIIITSSAPRFLLQERNPTKFKTLTFPPKSVASWTCSNRTFLNSPLQNSTFQICQSTQTQKQTQPPLSSFSPSYSSLSSSSKPKWSCKACTFLNSYRNNCEICGTRASASLISTFDTDDDELDSTVDETHSTKDLRTLKILSYNVWFRKDLEMHKRMNALGDLIQIHSPDLICLQEVTPSIYDIFQQSCWWKVYRCSVSNEMAFTRPYFCMQLSKLPGKSFNCKPFSNSIMGRELCVTEVAFKTDTPLVIATSHLESPCAGPPKWDQMYSKERVDQAKEALNFLKTNTNVIFCGDMNWDEKLDGQVPLPEGWVDAWKELRPGELGWTYDTKSSMMLSGNRTLQKRLDRFLCYLRDFKIDGIEMIGTEAIPGLSYCKEKKVKKEVKNLVLPVLPSDHYGLLLTICSQ